MKKIELLRYLAISMIIAGLALMLQPQTALHADATSPEQTLAGLRYVAAGVKGQGIGVLQVGEVNNLSAAVASATAAKVVTAPSAKATYIRAVFVEKSTGAAGTYTLTYGTGTNCGTGTTTLLGPVTNPSIGYNRIDVLVPSGKDLCLATDASTTSARVEYN